jgi:hypothetical protein
MRNRDEVFQKFQEMRESKLREMMGQYLRTSFLNCVSNCRLKVHGQGIVGFCQNPTVLKNTSSGMFVCNCDETSKKCTAYACRNTEEGVRELFDEILKSPSRCGERYPKLAMLIWFLQETEGTNRLLRLKYLCRQMLTSFWKIVSFRWY